MDRRAFLRSTATVASVSAISGCSTLGILGGNKPFTVIINYSGSWSGSVGSEDGQRSVQGSGREEFEVEGDIVSAVAQKRDASRGRLTVLIAVGDNVVKGKYTTAQYGTVSVSHRRGGEDEVSGEVNLNEEQQETENPEQEREEDRQELSNLEVDEVRTYADSDDIWVIVRVTNPTSEGSGADAVAELNINGRQFTKSRFLPIEPGTTEERMIPFSEGEINSDGPDVGPTDDLSPQGDENAVICEKTTEYEYQCDTPDYDVTVSIVPDYEAE
jgi:hypothetical protein